MNLEVSICKMIDESRFSLEVIENFEVVVSGLFEKWNYPKYNCDYLIKVITDSSQGFEI